MDRLINFTCEHCKQEFAIQPYFGEPCIHTNKDPLTMQEYYTAQTNAKAV